MYVVVDGVANVREQPSMQGRIIGTLARGIMVQVIGTDGEWSQIRYEQLPGSPWIHRSLLAETPPPTVAPTSTPAAAGMVRIVAECSRFDAPGNDNENLNEEYVCFENQGGAAVNLAGWRVHDDGQKHRYTFPEFTLGPGARVQVRSGRGSASSSDLYWGMEDSAIWNNGGDTVYLYDAGGNLVDKYSYPP